MEMKCVGSIEYNMDGLERFLPRTCEFLYVHWYQELGTFQADVTICLENLETGEIREIWYRRVDESTEEEVENREFKKFFNEHYRSLKGRKYAKNVLTSLLISERWIPDAKHRLEHLALYWRVERQGRRKIAVVVLMLEDCQNGEQQELWQTRVKMNNDIEKDDQYKEKLEKIIEEHYVALKGDDHVILTFTSSSKDSEWMELDIQKPGPDNRGMRGIRTVDKWQSKVKS